MELLDRTASFVIRNQMAKLAKDVSPDFDHVLVTDRHLEVRVDRFRRVCLEILVVGDQLDDPIPNFWADVIAGSRDELQYCVDIPFVLKAQETVSALQAL